MFASSKFVPFRSFAWYQKITSIHDRSQDIHIRQFYFTFFSPLWCFHFRFRSLVILSGWSRFACDSFCNSYYCIRRSYFSYCWQFEWYAIINLLHKMVRVFKKILKVFLWHGFLGTLGYVMSELEDGKKFSEVVKTAKSLGYTEPGMADILWFIFITIIICVNF